MESTEMQEPEDVNIPTPKNSKAQTITLNFPEVTANAEIKKPCFPTDIYWRPYQQKFLTPVERVKRSEWKKHHDAIYAKLRIEYKKRNEMLALTDQMKQMSTTVNAKPAAKTSEP